MTSFEKGVLVLIILSVIMIIANIFYVKQKMDEAGGIRKITVEAGREIRSIAKEINEEITKK